MTDLDLAELLCARLCHDLISPVSAIGNGLELVLSEPGTMTDDLRLIDDSARAAQATLTFYRLAFGLRGDDATRIAPAALSDLALGYFGKGRLNFDLPRSGPDLPRPIAKLALLLLLAAASAAPVGGVVRMAVPRLSPLDLSITVTGRRVALSPAALAMLHGDGSQRPELPRDAHFALLPRLAGSLAVRVWAEPGEDSVVLRAGARG